MSQGLELTPPAAQNLESMSAPSSADFLFEAPIRTKSKRRKPSRTPILRGLHQKELPTTESELVDMEGLRLYLHRNPLAVPLYSTRGWKYHHVNHPKSAFEQEDIDYEDRDHNLVALRRSSFQQVHMRISSEMIYHWVHEVDRQPPVTESVDRALRGFENLDMLGAASLFLNLSKGNSQYRVGEDYLVSNNEDDVPLAEKVSFISEVREDYTRAVVRADILPQRLVTSAIKRLSMHLKDPYLSNLADRRLASDPVFYPLRVPSQKTLLDKALRLINLEFQAREERAA